MLSRLNRIRKRSITFWATRLLQVRLRLGILYRQLRTWTARIAITLYSLGLGASVLTIPPLRTTADKFQSLETILTALGATYGTILALVLTLSIIPIQRAGEAWSASIVSLYRRDPVTHITFVALGVFCATSFLLAIPNLANISVSIVLMLSLFILGISLDALRWFHGHVCQLLDPTHAVDLVHQQAKRTIDQTNLHVKRIARLRRQLLNPAPQNQLPAEDIEAAIYPQMPGYPESINSRINDIAEISIKAVARGEKMLARSGIFVIAELTIHYLSTRKDNLTITPAPEAMFLAITSDTNVVTDRAYESLREISHAAANKSDEITAIRVSEALTKIAIHTANLDARAFREHNRPLTFAPVYYMMTCVKYAHSRDLYEIVFQSAEILTRVATSAPKDIVNTDIHHPVIDNLYEIAVYLYSKRRFGLAEEVNGHCLTILNHMLVQQDFYFKATLRHNLEKIEQLIPLAIANEAVEDSFSMVHPLSKVYGLINPNSLGYLFSNAIQTFPQVDNEREWLNPYHDLVDIADIIAEHLRKVAENNEFAGSFLLWEIDHFIKHIAVVITNLIDQPLRPGFADANELIDKFRWMLAFYWLAFDGKKSINENRAKECCESLVYIGLLFLIRDHSQVLQTSISHIRSILESYCEIATPPNDYILGDILAHLWGIRLLMHARDNTQLTQEIDHIVNTKPAGLSDEQWQDAQRAILLRRNQLQTRLGESNQYRERDSAETLLREELRESQQQPT